MIRRVLLSSWLLTGIGALLLALLVWFLGPLLSWLEPWPVRAGIVVFLVLVWALGNWWAGRRRRKRDDALAAGITAPAKKSALAPDRSGEEVAAVGEVLTRVLKVLKAARGTRGYLYEQPWYVIIGPPGAGKTTALVNSGLTFPLAAELGQAGKPGAVPGVGGTRLCEWWFTDEAVLIDTAGRYTTQDSDAAVDRAGWQGFLMLLKRNRPRQPLNGVFVAISLADIVTGMETMLAHAAAIRARVKELTTTLGIRLPIYVLFTKADQVTGFTEFFEDLDREKRAQVWGETFKRTASDMIVGPAAGFRRAFGDLVTRIEERVVDRLEAERSLERRQLISGFPAQVAMLAEPMDAFLLAAFGGSRLDPAPMLRGIYLTSGTQQGTTIDRLTGTMARAFGLPSARLASLRPEHGRSYFLGRLLKQVVFGEAMLVSEPPGQARRRLLLRAASFAAVGLATAGVAAALLVGRGSAEGDTNQLQAALSHYNKDATALKLDPVIDGDLQTVLPLLNEARDLPVGTAASDRWSPGPSQSATLSAVARTVYRHALERVMLPRLIWQLEAQMRGTLNQPDALYQLTRVYLMLGSQGPLDPDLIRQRLTDDWASTYGGLLREQTRAELARHLDALLAEKLPAVDLDGQLVENARRTFSRVTLAERVYSRIRPSAAAQRIPAWTPADALGASGQRVFVRPSGKKLSDGVPGFFTVEGFHRVLLPSLASKMREVLGESWVLGRNSVVDLATDPAVRTLETDVVTLYTNEYARIWDAMLADLAIVPLRDLQNAVQDLYILASPQSPLRDLLTSIARQLTLSMPPPPGPGIIAGAAEAAAGKAAAALGAVPADPPGLVIDQRFQALRDYVSKAPGAPVDITLKLLNDLQAQLAALAMAAQGGTAPAVAVGPDPTQMLRSEAFRQPPPISGWLQTLAAGGDRLRGNGAKQQASAAFNGPGGPGALCKRAVDGTYPFKADSPRDIPLDDFAKLFAPGGMMDAFFAQQLRAFVDQAPTGWKLLPVGGVEPPIGPADLAQFQKAAAIRDLFFAAGGATPSVKFEIMPVSSDPGVKQVTLDLAGTPIVDVHGPARATQVGWPGPQGMTTVRLVFDPPPSSGPPVIQTSGPWALFRMFNQGKMVPSTSPELYQLTFRFGDREAVFQIRAGSVNNPFSPSVLQGFQCPSVQ